MRVNEEAGIIWQALLAGRTGAAGTGAANMFPG
jgi:hypothetical protein